VGLLDMGDISNLWTCSHRGFGSGKLKTTEVRHHSDAGLPTQIEKGRESVSNQRSYVRAWQWKKILGTIRQVSQGG